MTETLIDVPLRRTQAERRALTRAALLEATITVLVAHGYARLTTADVARVAGVTRGAQAHHFGSKAELVSAALRHVGDRLTTEYVATLPEQGRSEARTIERVLDAMWELHRSDLFTAAFELWLAARTDVELRPSLAALERHVVVQAAELTTRLLPDTFARPGAAGVLGATMATMRGLAMLAFVHEDVDREWRAARKHLLESWRSLLPQPS